MIDGYIRGSRMYGVSDENSDIDLYVISDEKLEGSFTTYDDEGTKVDIEVLSHKTFQRLLDDHDIAALEVYFFYDLSDKFSFTLDKAKLRHSISQKASNSWVKCKKKLTVEMEKLDKPFLRQDMHRIGTKSLWHSFRILDFGVQIAKHGKIVDFQSCNHLYLDMTMYGQTWDDIKKKWQEPHNKAFSALREVAPKE